MWNTSSGMGGAGYQPEHPLAGESPSHQATIAVAKEYTEKWLRTTHRVLVSVTTGRVFAQPLNRVADNPNEGNDLG